MLIDKQEQVPEKAKKFPRSLQRLIDGGGTKRSDLRYKEFDCRKR